MKQCYICGCSVSASESTCPACLKSLEPRDMTWDEFKWLLVAAGWTEAEADQEVEDMVNEVESGMP